jgi:hypothetical protein
MLPPTSYTLALVIQSTADKSTISNYEFVSQSKTAVIQKKATETWVNYFCKYHPITTTGQLA